MARYLLIEFDDDAQADALRAQIDTATRKGRKYRVVGLFARPGRPCRCYNSREDYVKGITKESKAIRGSRFGWFICPKCKRPRFGSNYPINLIQPEDVIEPTLHEALDWFGLPPKVKSYRFFPEMLHVNPIPELGVENADGP